MSYAEDQNNIPPVAGNQQFVPVITVIEGKEKGTKKRLGKARFIVGRKVGDLLLTDSKISSAHFAIEAQPQGATLIDLDSTNGTLLNDNKVKMALLKDGDRIKIGATVIEFSLEFLDGQESSIALGSEGEITGGRHGDTEKILEDGIDTRVREKTQSASDGSGMIDVEAQLAAPASRYFLKVIGGMHEGEIFPLKGDRVVLGRISADINFEDKSIARKHATIEFSDNEITLRDLTNEEGLYVNGRRVLNCKLKGGEKIQMGNTTLEFLLE